MNWICVSIRAIKLIQAVFNVVIFGFIIESMVRYLIPMREKRTYVLVFYALATACASLSLADGIYFAIKPDTYIDFKQMEHSSDPALSIPMYLIQGETFIINTLIIAVTCTMYHLYLTLTFIFDGVEKRSMSEVHKKDRIATLLGISIVCLNFVTGVVYITFDNWSQRSAFADGIVVSTIGMEVFLSCLLLVTYSIVIFKLYSKVRHLKEMKEEKNAIIIQIVIFWIAIITSVLCKVNDFVEKILWTYQQDEESDSSALAASIKQLIFFGTPLLYMLLTHRRTY